MIRTHWLYCALILCAALAALNLLAFEYYLYWRFWWYDVMMHFLGGIAIGTFLIALSKQPRPRLYAALFAAIAIGWEVFEYFFGLPREKNYVLDTATDLVMDTLGATVVYLIAQKTLWRKA